MVTTPNDPRGSSRPTLDSERARQGGRGTPVVLVLISALVLLAIGWFGVEMYGNWIAPPNSDEAGKTTTQP